MEVITKCYSITLFILDNFFHSRDITKKIITAILSKVDFPESNCEHGKSTKLVIVKKLVHALLFNYVKQLDNVMHGKDLRPITKNDPTAFQSARLLYTKYKRK